MNKQFECDGDSTSARRLPWKTLPAQCGRHVRVAKVIVNNNPETVKRRRRSFCTAAGWSFARTKQAYSPLGFVWPKCVAPPPRPHAEEHCGRMRAQVLPQPKCAAMRLEA